MRQHPGPTHACAPRAEEPVGTRGASFPDSASPGCWSPLIWEQLWKRHMPTVLGPHLAILRAYFGLCTQTSLQARLKEPYVIPGMGLGLVMCEASDLPTVLRYQTLTP